MNLKSTFRTLRHGRIAVTTMVVLLCAWLLVDARAADQSGPSGVIPWVDVRVHLLSGTGVQNDFAGAARAAVSAMDSGMVKAVVLPMPQAAGGRPPFDWRDFADALGQHPGKFAFLGGGGTLNPIILDNARRTSIEDQTRAEFTRLAQEIIAGGASGFGEMAAHHMSAMPGHPYESVPPDHPLFLLLADIAARHDVVIDLHLDLVVSDMPLPPGFRSPHNPPTLVANLAGFERLLARERAAKIVWAHAGSDLLGNLTASRARELLTKHPNLYMSLRMPGQPVPGAPPQLPGQPGMPQGGMMPGRPMPPGGMRGGPMGPGGSTGRGGPPGPGGPMGQGQQMFARSLAHVAFTPQGQPNPEWLELVKDFSDRFVLGGDQFIASPNLKGSGAGTMFAQFAPTIRRRAQEFLAALPSDVAKKLGTENAARLYKLNPTPSK